MSQCAFDIDTRKCMPTIRSCSDPTLFKNNSAKPCVSTSLLWEKNLQGLKSWAWLPKFCRTFVVLQSLSSTSFSLCETLRRTFLQNPKVPRNSGEPLGAQIHLLRTGFFFSHHAKAKTPKLLSVIGVFCTCTVDCDKGFDSMWVPRSVQRSLKIQSSLGQRETR